MDHTFCDICGAAHHLQLVTDVNPWPLARAAGAKTSREGQSDMFAQPSLRHITQEPEHPADLGEQLNYTPWPAGCMLAEMPRDGRLMKAKMIFIS